MYSVNLRAAVSARLKGWSLKTFVPMKEMGPAWVELHFESSTVSPT